MSRTVLVIALTFACVVAATVPASVVHDLLSYGRDDSQPAVNSMMIRYINSLPNNTWRAGYQRRFAGHKIAHVKGLCGVVPSGHRLPVRDVKPAVELPTDFDSRVAWGAICPETKDIRHQGSCGVFLERRRFAPRAPLTLMVMQAPAGRSALWRRALTASASR
jgi:hypothetical protein